MFCHVPSRGHLQHATAAFIAAHQLCPVLFVPAGIDRSRVEDMEQRLKRDVLREAQRYDNHILVTEEDDDMNVNLHNTHLLAMPHVAILSTMALVAAEPLI